MSLQVLDTIFNSTARDELIKEDNEDDEIMEFIPVLIQSLEREEHTRNKNFYEKVRSILAFLIQLHEYKIYSEN